MSVARVAVGTVELHLPDVGSLKGKRHVLKGLKDKLRRRFEVSVAEVDDQDMWQRAQRLSYSAATLLNGAPPSPSPMSPAARVTPTK